MRNIWKRLVETLKDMPYLIYWNLPSLGVWRTLLLSLSVCLCLYCYYKMIRNPLLFENVAYFESLKHLVSVFVSVYVFVSVSVSVFFMYLSCLCPHMCRKINQNEKKIKNMHKWKSMNRLRAKSLMPEVNLTPGCLESPSNFQISGRKETRRMFAFISRGDNFLQGHSMFCE